MNEVKQRLEKGVAILADLDQKRRDTRNAQWGRETQYLIIDHELRLLENDILADPGALEPQLIKLPRQYPGVPE